MLKTGYVVHESAEGAKVSVYLPKTEPAKVERLAADALKASGLSVERVGGVFVVARAKEKELELFTYRPRFRSVSYLVNIASSAFPGVDFGGRRAVANMPVVTSNGQPSQVHPITGDSGASANFDKGGQDVFVARIQPEKLASLTKLLADLDIEAAEVVVRAVAYEVQKTAKEGSALNLVLSLLNSRLGLELNGKLAAADSTISLKIGGFDAVISALDSDTRFKSVSRPSVRVKSGSLARFAVGSDVPVLGAVVQQQLGNAVQSVEYRSSGVLLDVTPQVREDRIELKLKQEFSAFVQTSTGVQNSPTLNKRSAETELTLQPGEVVFIGGLESDEITDSSQSGFFGMMYGKAGERRQNELILMVEAKRI